MVPPSLTIPSVDKHGAPTARLKIILDLLVDVQTWACLISCSTAASGPCHRTTLMQILKYDGYSHARSARKLPEDTRVSAHLSQLVRGLPRWRRNVSEAQLSEHAPSPQVADSARGFMCRGERGDIESGPQSESERQWQQRGDGRSGVAARDLANSREVEIGALACLLALSGPSAPDASEAFLRDALREDDAAALSGNIACYTRGCELMFPATVHRMRRVRQASESINSDAHDASAAQLEDSAGCPFRRAVTTHTSALISSAHAPGDLRPKYALTETQLSRTRVQSKKTADSMAINTEIDRVAAGERESKSGTSGGRKESWPRRATLEFRVVSE
ncbi:hypothetical protein VTO73DRAFT_3471 [Trametes versicolor]